MTDSDDEWKLGDGDRRGYTGQAADANWYIELSKIKDVEGIAVMDVFYPNVEAARGVFDYNFYSGYGSAMGLRFTCWTKYRFISL